MGTTLNANANANIMRMRAHWWAGTVPRDSGEPATCRLPFQAPARPLPPVARRIGAPAGDDEEITRRCRPAFPLARIRYQVPCRCMPLGGCALAPSGEGTYLRRALCCVAAAAGSVPRTWPLYGSMNRTGRGHEPSTGRGSTRPPCVTGQTIMQTDNGISRGFIKLFLAYRDDETVAAQTVAPENDSLQDHTHPNSWLIYTCK